MKGFPNIITEARGKWYQKVNAVVNEIDTGDTTEKRVQILGKPDTIQSTDTMLTPSTCFEHIGSRFRFRDQEAEEVWIYHDPYRPRILYECYVQQGTIVATWKRVQ